MSERPLDKKRKLLHSLAERMGVIVILTEVLEQDAPPDSQLKLDLADILDRARKACIEFHEFRKLL